MNGTALDWFRFYLSSRSQRVSDRGAVSDKFDLRYGVPQCSRLGPLLLTVYASALFDVVEKHLPAVHCYADDSQLYISLSPKAHSGQVDAVASIEHCIQDIRQWMSQDKLLMNDAKTELLLIDTRQQLAKITTDGITVGHSVIAPQSPIRNPGVWLDSDLSIGDHITKTSSAAFYYLYNIRRIRKYLSKECTETLIHAFISSRLDYCNSLLYGLPAYQIQKLQRVQNSAARLVFHESKFCHITPLLRALHWLPVAYRIVLKILLLTFKAIHKLAPTYISELVSLKNTGSTILDQMTANFLTFHHAGLFPRLMIDLFIWLPLNYGTNFLFLLEIYLQLMLSRRLLKLIYFRRRFPAYLLFLFFL